MNSKNLEQRLDDLNQYKIDLGLQRLQSVLKRLDLSSPKQQIITVGGTNGKGSTVTAICALLAGQKKSYGAFTSPHIFHFNERINVNGQDASDEEILAAFDAIDAVKGETNLSYFEYAFLAALLVFVKQDVEVMVLEVGLGGRLDATNSVDSDVAIITTVDIDHTEWLGNDIESIAREKAGIIRNNKSIIYGDANVPQAIINVAQDKHAKLIRQAEDFSINTNGQHFNYQFHSLTHNSLKLPALQGHWQLKNFASALTALLELGHVFSTEDLQLALASWQINGRLQTMQESPLVLADVSHNKQAVTQLAQWLSLNPVEGQTRAVFSVLADKHVEQWLPLLNDVIDHWFIFQLPGSRAMNINDLKIIMADHVGLISQFEDGKQAYEMALLNSDKNDRVIVFGSFHVLNEVFK